MIKYFKVGKYEQTIKIKEGKATHINCTCKHFSLYPDNWFKGEKICKHLKEALLKCWRLDDEETRKAEISKTV